MRITLNEAEHSLLREYGKKYREKTGKLYSTYYMMNLLAQIYSDRLGDDMQKVLDQKLIEAKELEAEEKRTNN